MVEYELFTVNYRVTSRTGLAILVDFADMSEEWIPLSCIGDVWIDGEYVTLDELNEGDEIEIEIVTWFCEKKGWI